MKRAVLIHGTDGSPEMIWFPWMKAQLQARGYEVWSPNMPNNHTPNRQVYNDFLFSAGWDFTDNLVIGHSSGAVSVLNLLMDERCPKIKTGVMIGVWAHMRDTDLDFEQFKALFDEEGFDFEKIKQNSEQLLFLHGDNDPFCPLDQAKWLAEQTNSDIVIVPNGGHLGRGLTELPVVFDELEKREWL